jgi:hypothetical protein
MPNRSDRLGEAGPLGSCADFRNIEHQEELRKSVSSAPTMTDVITANISMSEYGNRIRNFAKVSQL